MRILGIDQIGSTVYGVEIESSFGRFEIKNTIEATSYADCLKQTGRPPQKIVMAPPSEMTTFRNLNFSSRSKKTISQAIEFELEDELPFDIETIQSSWVIIPDKTAKSAVVHTSVVSKEPFSLWLSGIQSEGIDPDVITTHAFGVRSLFSRLPELSAQSPLLMCVHETKSEFLFFHQGTPIIIKEIPIGYQDLRSAVAQTLNSTLEESQRILSDIGFTAVDERAARVVADCFEPWILELKQVELAARASTKQAPGKIWVTGSAALIPGFFPYLSQSLGTDVEFFKPLQLLSKNGTSYSDLSEIFFERPLALAMAIVPADKCSVLNLRSGSFSKGGQSDSTSVIEQRLQESTPLFFLALFIFLGVNWVEKSVYEKKVEMLEDKLKSATRGYFRGVGEGTIKSLMNNPEKLRRTVKDDLQKERDLVRLMAPNPNSPPKILKSISQKLTRDLVLELEEFDTKNIGTSGYVAGEPQEIKLKVNVDNPQILARVTEVLTQNFSLQAGKSTEILKNKRPSYQIIYTGTLKSPGGSKL